MSFPGKILALRTDEDFRQNLYADDYQKSETILNHIPRLGLVNNVPLDPMHLVYLGCVRKLLLIWLCSSLPCKLPHITQTHISNCFESLKVHVLYEFARKPRALKHIKLFKATEFRQLILYIGVIALKNFLKESIYVNYLTLHIAVTILGNPYLYLQKDYVDYAEQLLTKFVRNFENIYGKRYVSHNIHNLLHLTNDARKFGTLEEFSAF